MKKICEVCGEAFDTKSQGRYCSDTCRAMARYSRRKHRNKTGSAHQSDPTVWTHDYAERQKAKTLEMIGKIKI